MKRCAPFLLSLIWSSASAAEADYRYRLTSLFQPDRIEEFRHLMSEKFPEIRVMEVDFHTAIATLRLDLKQIKDIKGLNTAKNPEELRSKLSLLLRGASRGVFEFLPLSEVPADQIEEALIPISGLDCKGCTYAAYKAVARVDGVEYATASLKTGEVRVRFDRRKTSVTAVEEALNQAQIATLYRIEAENLVPPSEMKIVRCSSEETQRDEVYFHSSGEASNVLDGDPLTKWSSHYTKGETPPHPHELVIDLGKTRKIAGFRYLPRQLGYGGQFAKTEFFVSENARDFGDKPAAETTFTASKRAQAADCPLPVSGRYVLVRVMSEIRGKPIAAAAEIGVVQAP